MQLLLIQKHRLLQAEILAFPFVCKKKNAESENSRLNRIYGHMSTARKLPASTPQPSQVTKFNFCGDSKIYQTKAWCLGPHLMQHSGVWETQTSRVEIIQIHFFFTFLT